VVVSIQPRQYDACNEAIQRSTATLHRDVCLGKKQVTINLDLEVGAVVVSGKLGGSISVDSYTQCSNQLNLDAQALLGSCKTAQSTAIEKACNG